MRLVPFNAHWQDWFCQIMDDPKEKEFVYVPKHVHGYQVLQEFVTKQDQGTAAMLGAEHEGKKVGYLFLDRVDVLNRNCFGHIFIAPDFRNQGLLTELIKQTKSYVFEDLGLNVLYGETPADRFPLIWPVLQAEGFSKVGTIPQFKRYNGKYVDVIMTSIVQGG